jgi:hypothetical protein
MVGNRLITEMFGKNIGICTRMGKNMLFLSEYYQNIHVVGKQFYEYNRAICRSDRKQVKNDHVEQESCPENEQYLLRILIPQVMEKMVSLDMMGRFR